jgi:hypothetical protein
VVRAGSPLAGWLVYPVYGVAIGALFGWLLGHGALDKVRAAMWGGLYGVGWWIAAELVLIPVLLAVWPLSASAVDRVRDVALPLLIGHVVYGVILGIAWSRFMEVRPMPPRRAPSWRERPDTFSSRLLLRRSGFDHHALGIPCGRESGVKEI